MHGCSGEESSPRQDNEAPQRDFQFVGNHVLDEIQQFRQTASLEPSNIAAPKKSYWQIFLFGQAIALFSASTNASSFTLIYGIGITIPIFQTGITYFFLSLHLWYQFQEQEEQREVCDVTKDEMTRRSREHFLPFTKLRLRVPWWIYFGIAFLDVESNYLVMLSFRYTSLTSTTLLLSLTTPSTMFVSCYMLARVFTTRHHVGVCLCLLGGTMTVWSDLGGTAKGLDSISQPNHSYVGDLLAISGALLYGLTDTVAEYSIKHIDRVEYLGMLGLFGSLISVIQFPFVEWDELVNLITRTSPGTQLEALLVMVWYICSLWFYYVCASFFLTTADATLLNLSLQSSQLWAILFTVLAERVVPRPLFFAAVIMVVTGVFVYETGPFPEETQTIETKSVVATCTDEKEREEEFVNTQRDTGYGSLDIA